MSGASSPGLTRPSETSTAARTAPQPGVAEHEDHGRAQLVDGEGQAGHVGRLGHVAGHPAHEELADAAVEHQLRGDPRVGAGEHGDVGRLPVGEVVAELDAAVGVQRAARGEPGVPLLEARQRLIGRRRPGEDRGSGSDMAPIVGATLAGGASRRCQNDPMASVLDALDDSLTDVDRRPAGVLRRHRADAAAATSTCRRRATTRSACSARTRVAYLDLTGSGNETIAHLRQNGRITIMFCAFDGTAADPPPLRHRPSRAPVTTRWGELAPRFELLPGARAIITLDIDRIAAPAATRCRSWRSSASAAPCSSGRAARTTRTWWPTGR